MGRAEANAERLKIKADNEAAIIRANAAAELEIAKCLSKAKEIEVNAEVEHAANWQGLRDHKERMMSVDALGNLSTNGKVVIAGKQGQELINEYTKGLDEINEKFQ
jgi:hypothetical protein